ncbi:MAG: response regulator transcription factor, partial [Erysipelotrichaceae bacterium]|nr:response regulator transcription factor [Erysipelotrichaceae bacterium]
IDGIETAKRLQEQNSDFFIVIITSQIEYALRGYDIHAYSFLPKPLKYSSVKRSLNDIFELKKKNTSFKLQMKNGTDYDIYEHKEIIYLEIYKHSLTVVTDHDRKVYNQPLNELENILRPYGFFRCHKSYLVNIDRIRHLSAKELMMDNGDPVPVSKYRKDELMELFLDRSGALR